MMSILDKSPALDLSIQEYTTDIVLTLFITY